MLNSPRGKDLIDFRSSRLRSKPMGNSGYWMKWSRKLDGNVPLSLTPTSVLLVISSRSRRLDTPRLNFYFLTVVSCVQS